MSVGTRRDERVAAAVDGALHAAWADLRSFFSEGYAALERSLEAFRRAEPEVRGSADTSVLTLWLLGISAALQHVRSPEATETALARARELVNLVVRTQGEDASIPYRVRVEECHRDLADIDPSVAERALVQGLEYGDRTLRLAKDAARDDWLAASLASRADLLARTAGGNRRALKRALTLFEDAKSRWPVRDAPGRAELALRHAEGLLVAGDAARAEMMVRDALPQFERDHDRYHEATGRWLLARALFALDRSEALDEQALAVDAFRALGTRWELRRAERAFE
jgi:hypothetical protein